MGRRIEDYAIVGDTETVALISSHGSVDWLCLPSFDSGACFAALLGDPSHGRWELRPAGEIRAVRRRYRPGTLVLETELDTDEGTVRLVDSMPPRGTQHGDNPDLVRVVAGVRGRVAMRMELRIRFDYGSIVPWVTRVDGGVRAVAGPDALTLTTPVETRGEHLATVAEFTVAEGDEVPFVLTWHPSHRPVPTPVDPRRSVDATTEWWRSWSATDGYRGDWHDAVERSLITLKALTYAPTGGIVAAATTSLPEDPGGQRNWDYRFVWIRDATFTLRALMLGGHQQEAVAWRDWLLRAVAGEPSRLQIMYGLGGQRRLPELELDWLPGYEGSRPVRIGNAASEQFQLDVYGETLDTLAYARRAGIDAHEASWDLQRALIEYLESAWREPDHGLWEVRGPKRHFTHSRVLSWVAFDRAVNAVERAGLDGPVDRWRALRDEIHAEVCREGYDADRGTFTQSYGDDRLDASLLVIPQVGFLEPDDPRVLGTVDAIDRELTVDGVFVYRYDPDPSVEGLPGDEGTFLLCSFWMVDALAMAGRTDEAQRRFERLMAVRNDVGLLAEEYDPVAGRQLGNFPQAFSHIGLVNSACNLSARRAAPGRAEAPDRAEG